MCVSRIQASDFCCDDKSKLCHEFDVNILTAGYAGKST